MTTTVRLLLALALAGTALQCQDRGPTSVDRSGGLEPSAACPTGTALVDEICGLLNEIFTGKNESAAFSQFNAIVKQYNRYIATSAPNRLADAQAKTNALIEFILARHEEGHTLPDSEDEMALVIPKLLQFVDLGALGFTIDPAAFQEGGNAGFGRCDSESCLVLTGNKQGGFNGAPGIFDNEAWISIRGILPFPPWMAWFPP